MGSTTALEPGVAHACHRVDAILTKPYVGVVVDGNSPVIKAQYVPLDAAPDVTVVTGTVSAQLGDVDIEVSVSLDKDLRDGLWIAPLLLGHSAYASIGFSEAGITNAMALIDVGPSFADARVDAAFECNEAAQLEGGVRARVA